MKSLLTIFLIIQTASAIAYELQEIYYFPKKGESSFKFSTHLKDLEISYEENTANLNSNDLEELEQQILILEPEYKFSLSSKFLAQVSFKVQALNISTNFEDIYDNETKTNSINALYDPSIYLRYRAIKKEHVFVDLIFEQIFKTHTYSEGNKTRPSRTYSGKNITSFAGELGYQFKYFQLRTNLHLDLYSRISSQYLQFDEVFRSDYTYSIGYGAEVLIRLTKDLNYKLAFDTSSINAYDVKSPTSNVHVDEVLTSKYLTSLEYKKFEKSFAIVSLELGYKTIYNRVTKDSVILRSDSKTSIATIIFEKRFK